MNRLVFFVLLFLFCQSPEFVLGQELAFPGAIGHGKNAGGGRRGRIIEVTNLQDSGAGSLHAAMEDSTGARVIVFKVGGVALRTNNISTDNDSMIVLGQTAPTPYVMVGGGIILRGDDQILQGMYMAISDTSASPIAPEGRDNIQIGNGAAAILQQRLIVDHCTVMYSQDENMATFDSCAYVSWTYNVAGQPLNQSGHPNGAHGLNHLISGEYTFYHSVIGNYYCHQESRGEKWGTDSNGESINNVTYNWRTRAFLLDSAATVNRTHNIAKQGPNQLGGAGSPRWHSVYLNPDLSSPRDGTVLYLSNNIDAHFRPTNNSSTNWSMVFDQADTTANKSATPQATASGYVPLAVETLWANLKTEFGRQHLGVQDSVVLAWVNDYDTDGGQVIDTAPLIDFDSTNVADYAYMTDTDGDGMWDSFEAGFGSDSLSADAFTSYNGFEYWQYFAYYALHGSHFATLPAAAAAATEGRHGKYGKYQGYERY